MRGLHGPEISYLSPVLALQSSLLYLLGEGEGKRGCQVGDRGGRGGAREVTRDRGHFGGCTTLYMLTLCHSMYTCIRPAPWEEGSSISIVPIIRTNTVPHYTRGGGMEQSFSPLFIVGFHLFRFRARAGVCERERDRQEQTRDSDTGPKKKKERYVRQPSFVLDFFFRVYGAQAMYIQMQSDTTLYRYDSIDCSNEISRTVSIILVAYCARV